MSYELLKCSYANVCDKWYVYSTDCWATADAYQQTCGKRFNGSLSPDE